MQRNKLWFVALVALFTVSASAQNTFPASGNVGMGTTSPAGVLHISGPNQNGNATPLFKATDTNTNQILAIDNGGNANDFRIVTWGGTGNLELQAGGNPNQLMLNSSGNVGIGTMGSTARLQIGNPSTTGGTVGAFSPVLQTFGSTDLSSTAGTDLSLASIGFATGNNVALGIHGFRASTGSGWNTSAIGLGMDVDNTTRAGANIWLNANGNVGIGTTIPQYLLSVNGTIQAKEVLVNTGWADYVFGPDYTVRPLPEVAAFIKTNHHLPDIPSEAEVKEKGVSLGDMQSKLLAKIEELTLQMIQLNEDNTALKNEWCSLKDAKASSSGRNGGK